MKEGFVHFSLKFFYFIKSRNKWNLFFDWEKEWIIDPCGETYDGQWSDDKKNGYGTFKLPSGESYVGQWTDGLRNGNGTFKWANGATYEGQYREGVKIGHWTFTLSSPPPEPHCPYCAG